MGRKKKRVVIKRVKPKLPEFFLCPRCGSQTIQVELNRKELFAVIKCGSCGLKEEIKISRGSQPVDAYAKFIDEYSS